MCPWEPIRWEAKFFLAHRWLTFRLSTFQNLCLYLCQNSKPYFLHFFRFWVPESRWNGKQNSSWLDETRADLPSLRSFMGQPQLKPQLTDAQVGSMVHCWLRRAWQSMDKERGAEAGRRKQEAVWRVWPLSLSLQNANFISMCHFRSMDKERKALWVRRD